VTMFSVSHIKCNHTAWDVACVLQQTRLAIENSTISTRLW